MTIPSSQLRASAGQGGIVQGFHLLRSQDIFRNGSYGIQSTFPPSIMIPSSIVDQHKYLSFPCKRMAHPDGPDYLPTKNGILDRPLKNPDDTKNLFFGRQIL